MIPQKSLNKKVIVFIVGCFCLTINTCHAQLILNKLNQKHLYDGYQEISVNYQLVKSDTALSLFFQLTLSKHLSIRGFQYSYQLIRDYEDNINITQPTFLSLADNMIDSTDHNYYFNTSIIAGSSPTILLLNISDTVNTRYFYYDITLNHPKDFPDSDLLIWVEGQEHPHLKPFLSASNSFKIISYYDSVEQVFAYHYRDNFKYAEPPMITSTSLSKRLTIDSMFTIPTGSNINLQKEGLYFFQSDTNSFNGISIRISDRYFPRIKHIRKIIDPLVYISTQEEAEELRSADNIKQALDRYLFDLTRSSQRAKRIVRRYFNQTANANIFFTNYKEGWKTDQGMIYLTFGLPDQVLRSWDLETWVYFKLGNRPEVRFDFKKVKNIFSSKHYQLIRDNTFDQVWFNQVGSWRKGRPLIKD